MGFGLIPKQPISELNRIPRTTHDASERPVCPKPVRHLAQVSDFSCPFQVLATKIRKTASLLVQVGPVNQSAKVHCDQNMAKLHSAPESSEKQGAKSTNVTSTRRSIFQVSSCQNLKALLELIRSDIFCAVGYPTLKTAACT